MPVGEPAREALAQGSCQAPSSPPLTSWWRPTTVAAWRAGRAMRVRAIHITQLVDSPRADKLVRRIDMPGPRKKSLRPPSRAPAASPGRGSEESDEVRRKLGKALGANHHAR